MLSDLKQLEKLYIKAKEMYYNSDNPIMSDLEFDNLEDKIRELNPNSKVLKVIGIEVKNGIKLPYNMMSLNKKKEEKDIVKWRLKYDKENIILTDKLDGLSIIAIYENNNIQLITRGDGKYGLDITKLVKYIDIPTNVFHERLVIRGEIIMKKSIFESKYKSKYANARNLVSGAILRKNIVKSVVEDIDIVWYSVYYPENLLYLDELELLYQNKFKIAHYTVIDKNNLDTINKHNLTEYLKDRIEQSHYNIDGVVVKYNALMDLKITKNPENAFAFKINGETKEVIVTNIKWNVSKHNKMIPIIIIEPTNLSEVLIKQITGINAKYILDNKIGRGSLVKIVRSGEVIPKVLEVISAKFNINTDFPTNYIWQDNGYHIMPSNDEDERVIKMLDDSFKKLDVDGLNIATITKLYYAKYNTILKILNITVNDLIKLDNFQETSANKLYKNIHKAYNNASFAVIMDFSNLLGENIAIKNIKIILKALPNILVLSKTISKKELIERLNDISGIGPVKAKLIANNIDKFITFYEKLPKQNKPVIKSSIKVDKRFKNKNVVFSGIRDKNLETIIEISGGKVLSTISKETNILIVKDKNANTSKINKARDLGISIINYTEI